MQGWGDPPGNRRGVPGGCKAARCRVLSRVRSDYAKRLPAGPLMDFSRIKQIWAGLDTRSQLTLVGGIAGVLVTFYLLYGFATKPSYTTLATGLQPAQTGQAEQTLAAAGIAYRVGTGGTELDVPAGQVSQARIALAAKGVLTSGQNSF